MKRTSVLIVLAILMTAGAALAAEAKAPEAEMKKHIDLVICLDTSGSMRGLIESAKQKLWAVVNELATAKPRPALRVALYHYGNSGLSRESGWVQQLSKLTGDLDSIYGKLFPLTTNGGTEYVSRVVRAATEELDWNMDKGTLRVIFVAGNEAATQDTTYPLQETCKAAASKGIIINTIFCGSDASGRKTGWEDAAKWADGRYAAIDQDRGTVVVNTPYDKKLAELGGELNRTYVTYGRAGEVGAAMQKAMDGKAAKLHPSAAAERTQSKASGLYVNTKWDLVDATRQGGVKLEDLAEAELPDEMKKMTPEQRKAHVEKQGRRRAEIQKEIQAVSAKRGDYVKKEMAKQGLSDKHSLDAALRAAVREQAERKDFKFKK
ncbi:MAG: vWA domain-containing protein [Phycisphaerae bacterium]